MSEGEWSAPQPLQTTPQSSGRELGRYPAYIEHYFWPDTITRRRQRAGARDLQKTFSAVLDYLEAES